MNGWYQSGKIELMSAPLVPSPLDYIGRRRFAFYPAIPNAGPNEWVLGTGSRSEVQVVNARTGGEIWIPRQYVGAVSDTDGPLLVVGLRKQVVFNEGCLEPRVKRVIEMPQTAYDQRVDSARGRHRAPGLAPVVGIRLEVQKTSPVRKLVLCVAIGALLAGLLATLIGAAVRF